METHDRDRSGYLLAMASFKREDLNMPGLTHVTKLVSNLAIAGIVVACAAQYKEQAFQQPTRINCASAEGDIRVLQNEKSRLAQQVAMGITAIAPASIVMGVLIGTEQTKLQVATGDYNQMIDQRSGDLRMTCGLR
jgi:hypothetical protein